VAGLLALHGRFRRSPLTTPWRPGRATSLLFVAAVYVVTIGAAWWVFTHAGMHPLWNVALGMLAGTGVTFVAGWAVRNGSVFDAYWSVIPPFVALYLLVEGTIGPGARALALLAVVFLWALRLTLNWARGWDDLSHQDWRYPMLEERSPLPAPLTMLLGVMLFPTLVIFLGCLPMYPALMLGDGGFGALDAAALAVGIAASVIELVADEQMRAFGRTKQPGDVMSGGLWKYSRHPNYFGEILFWVSLFLFGLAADPGSWWTGIGVVVMVAMFVFASIPMLDERSRERRPGFDDYAARTSSLVPLPPRSSKG